MERRKFVVGLGALAAGGSAAVGSGAFTAMEADGRDATIDVVNDADALLGLEAGDSTLVTDTGGSGGELEIDFTSEEGGQGVNPNSIYQVGGLGGVETDPDSPLGALTEGDVDFPGSINDESIAVEYAFKVKNQTGSDQPVQLAYDATEDPFPDNAAVFMIATAGSQEEALAASVDNDERRGSLYWKDDVPGTSDIGSGEAEHVTIMVVVEDLDPSEDKTDLGGTITVRAGSHDDFPEP